MDIVVPSGGVATGLLAETPEEYADAMAYVLGLDDVGAKSIHWCKWKEGETWTTEEMRVAGRASSQRFSEECFKNQFKVHVRKVV